MTPPEQRQALQAERRVQRTRERIAERQVKKPRRERKTRQTAAPEGVLQELWSNPRPLVSEELGLAVIWSPKSGCSFVSKWFFAQVEVEVVGWVHRQRRTFQNSSDSVAAATALSSEPGRFAKLRVARNPYDRAVSSYLHYLAKADRDDGSIGRDRDHVWAGKAELSFRDFIGGLRTTDSSVVNVHWRPQIHPAEQAGLFEGATVVKLEDSMTGLPRFETENGLRATDLAALRSSPHHSKREHEYDSFVGDTAFQGDIRTQSPDYELFYDRELLDDVFELYRDDFDRFSYDRR